MLPFKGKCLCISLALSYMSSSVHSIPRLVYDRKINDQPILFFFHSYSQIVGLAFHLSTKINEDSNIRDFPEF